MADKFTDEELVAYADHQDASDLDLHNHFDAFGKWDWLDIYPEGVRILNLWGYEIEEWSPIEGVISGVAAQSAHGAFASIAAMLGVDARSLEFAVAEWYENQHELPDPVGLDGLMKEIESAKEWLESLKKDNGHG